MEWNYKVIYPDDHGFLQAYRRVESLFSDPHALALTDAWIEAYEQRRRPPPRAIEAGSQEQEPSPTPTPIQQSALDALCLSRAKGYKRGLVVLATGLGKTWLAAFDTKQAGARKILFVAHREEILDQAAQTFIRLRPSSKVGFYRGKNRDTEVDVLCASVQTLARSSHLERFNPGHFDYIVIDEFHHAAASTYRKLLAYFTPNFLLGLTATPDRTDQSDILSLCDDNLVFTFNLFAGIEAQALAPFHYYGIADESVDYQAIPWRNGKFDPEQLSNKLATLARARHAVRIWQAHAQNKTLAFCASIAHAEFMAAQFNSHAITAAAVYSGSKLGRSAALEQLGNGQLKIILSVDLFSEGVDLPAIDTIMMLRPTESKILFLQQLGRGLRMSDDKTHLVVLDFIGNHHSFLSKPQALFGVEASYQALAAFGRKLQEGNLILPAGCYVNYALQIIDFLKSLDSKGTLQDYEALKNTLGRRPTLAEFYRSGASVQRMRKHYGAWFRLVKSAGDLSIDEIHALETADALLLEIETTAMTKSYKMILLEAWLDLDGFLHAPRLDALAEKSWDILNRRKHLLADLPESMQGITGNSSKWEKYWRDNPVNAWIGGNRDNTASAHFELRHGCLALAHATQADTQLLGTMIQELVDYRLASYEVRRAPPNFDASKNHHAASSRPIELPYFPDLKLACGHFREGLSKAVEYRRLDANPYGQIIEGQCFIAKASGNSMNGGLNPIHDGDNLLLELVTDPVNDALLNQTLAYERVAETGESQYVLRELLAYEGSGYHLHATNPQYQDIPLSADVRPIAKLKAILDPLDLLVGQSFMREDIPALFGETFNPGNWHAAHIVLNDKKAHVLLITMNKQGKSESQRYHDYWIDHQTLHWQTQNSTTPENKRGQEIIHHAALGISVYVFVRNGKLQSGKGAPFVFRGRARYVSHEGSKPMNVIFKLA